MRKKQLTDKEKDRFWKELIALEPKDGVFTRPRICPHRPHDPHSTQTVCKWCGAKIERMDQGSNDWQITKDAK